MTRTILLLVASLIHGAWCAPCPDGKDVDFLKGLNKEGEFRLAALQGGLYLLQIRACQGQDSLVLASLTLETGIARYHLGEFGAVRRDFRERAREADPTFRRYFLESHLLDLARPDLADSALNWLDNPSTVATVSNQERILYVAATYHLLERSALAKALWSSDPTGSFDQGYLSPGLGAGLSVVPGGGYFYAGQSGDGWTALTTVLLFYSLAAAYHHWDAPKRALIAAGAGGVFHLSGIYGGYRAAKETNRRRKRAFLMALHPHLP